MKKLSILIFSLLISFSGISQERFAPIQLDGITPKWTHLFVDSSRIVTDLAEGTAVNWVRDVYLLGDTIAYFVFLDISDNFSGAFIEKLDLNKGNSIWTTKFDVRTTGFHEIPAYFGIMENGLIELVSYKIAQDLHPIFGWSIGQFLRREIDPETGEELNIFYNEDYGGNERLNSFGHTRILKNGDNFFHYQPIIQEDGINPSNMISEFKHFSPYSDFLYMDSIVLPLPKEGFVYSVLHPFLEGFTSLRFSLQSIVFLDDPSEIDPDSFTTILDFFDADLQHSHEIDITDYLPAKWHSEIWGTYDDLILIKSQDSAYLKFYNILPDVYYSVFDKSGNHISDIALGKEITAGFNNPVHIPNTNEFLFFEISNPLARHKTLKVWHLDGDGETNLLRSLDFEDIRRISFRFNTRALSNGDVLLFYNGQTRAPNGISINSHNKVMRISAEDLGLKTSVVTHSRQDRRDLKAFPNPTTGPLTLKIPDGVKKGTLEIMDMRAGTVHRQKLDHPQERFSLDIGHLPAGVYHIELYPEENAERVFYGARVVLNASFD